MERPLLQAIADNQNLLEALRDELIEEFTRGDERTDDALSNEQLGQIYRARLMGVQKVEKVMQKILKYRSRDLSSPKINGAR